MSIYAGGDFINIYLVEIMNRKTSEVINTHSIWEDYREAEMVAAQLNESCWRGTLLHAEVYTRCLNLKKKP